MASGFETETQVIPKLRSVAWLSVVAFGAVCTAFVFVYGVRDVKQYSDMATEEVVSISVDNKISGEIVVVPLRFPDADIGKQVVAFSASCGCTSFYDRNGNSISFPVLIGAGDDQFNCRIDTTAKSGRSFFGIRAELISDQVRSEREFHAFINVSPGWITIPRSVELKDVSKGDVVDSFVHVFVEASCEQRLRLEKTDVRDPSHTRVEMVDRRHEAMRMLGDSVASGLIYRGSLQAQFTIAGLQEECLTLVGLEGRLRHRIPVYFIEKKGAISINPDVLFLRRTGDARSMWVNAEAEQGSLTISELPKWLKCEHVSTDAAGVTNGRKLHRFNLAIDPSLCPVTDGILRYEVKVSGKDVQAKVEVAVE